MEIMASAWVRGVTTFLFATICILLIVVILLQKGRGGGLAGAFGGAGGHSAFGAKTGDVFTWITVALTGMYIFVAVIGNFTFVPDNPAEAPPPAITATGGDDENAPAEPAAPAGSTSTTRPGTP